MKLSELIAKYGDEKVSFQNLDQCATALNYTAKKGTSITFSTSEALNPTGTDKLGLVLWLDRKKVEKIIAEATND